MCAYKLPVECCNPPQMNVIVEPIWDKVIREWNEDYLLNVLSSRPYLYWDKQQALIDYYLNDLGNKKEFLKYIFTTKTENKEIIEIMKCIYLNQDYYKLNQITWGLEDLGCNSYPDEEWESDECSEKLMDVLYQSKWVKKNGKMEELRIEPLMTSQNRGAIIYQITRKSLKRLGNKIYKDWGINYGESEFFNLSKEGQQAIKTKEFKLFLVARKILQIQKAFKKKLYNPHTPLGRRFALNQIAFAFDD